MFRVLRLAVTACVLSLSVVAMAQAEDPALKKLRFFNDDLKRGFAALEGGWGADPAAEEKRISKADGIAKSIAAALTDDLSSAGEAHTRVKQNLAALQGEIGNCRLAHTYGVVEAKVRAAHKAGTPASADDVKALQDAITQLKARGGTGWQATVAHFTQRSDRLVKDHKKLGGGATASIAPAVATPPPAAPAAPAGGLQDAIREANRQSRNVIRHLEDESTRIPPALLTAYREAAAKVSALSERAGRYYTTVYRDFSVADAWRLPDEQAFTTLPSLYQGDLVGQGTSKRKLKVTLDAPDGWCFGVVQTFRSFSGGEGLKDVAFKHANKEAQLMRFDVPHTGPGFQQVLGVCPTKPGKLTLTAKIEGAGAEARWVAIGWPKENVPLYVSEYMRLLPPDRCDDEAWYRSWTRPVPGTLVYVGAEPHLLVGAERPARDEATVLNVIGARKTMPKSGFTTKAPAKRQFASTFAWAGCPATEDARGEAKKLQRCLESVEKKFAANITREEKRAERAATDKTREKAEGRIAVLRAKEDAERATRCDPIDARIRDKAKRTFDRILDLHLDNAVVSTIDRADQLQAEQEADPELR